MPDPYFNGPGSAGAVSLGGMNMNWKRIGRTLVCLLVVCCLLVNISPIRARASLVEAAVSTAMVVSVHPAVAVASVLIGLGVQVGLSTVDFTTVTDLAVAHLQELGLCEQTSIDIFGYKVEGVSLFGITPRVIEAIQDWLFDNGIFEETTVPDGYAFYNGVLLPNSYETSHPWKALDYRAIVHVGTGSSYLMYTWASPPVYNGEKFYMSEVIYANCHKYIAVYNPLVLWKQYEKELLGTRWYDENGLVWASWDVEDENGNVVFPYTAPDTGTSITTDQDLNLGFVSKDLTGYQTWTNNSVSIPGSLVGSDEEYVQSYPIGIGPTFQDTMDMTQDQVWQGNSSYSSPELDLAENTFADTAVGTFIGALVDALMAPIKAIFVPSSDFITAKVESLRAEFAFADAIISTGEFIGTSLGDIQTEPPVIYIDLGASRGFYDLGGVVPFVDLRWYEEYKPAGDALLSAFMWAAFAWRMFVKAPGIISGMPGDFVMDGVNSLGMVDALPTRKKEYALQRQANRRLKDK